MNEKEKAKYRVPLKEGSSEMFRREVLMEMGKGILGRSLRDTQYGDISARVCDDDHSAI
jgi:hypothetical protein